MRWISQSWRTWHETLTLREKKWIWIICIVALLTTTAPYFYGAAVTPPNHDFQGVHRVSIDDTFVYYSYINQVQQGQWLLYDLMTGESQHYGLFNIVWLAVGWCGAALQLGPTATFHLARVILIIPAIWIIYFVITTFLPRPLERIAGLWLTVFGGGFGWVAAPFINRALHDDPRRLMNFWPIDLWQTEAFVFNILFQSPHFILSLSFLLLVIVGIGRSLQSQRWQPIGITAILIVIWLNFHPYYAPLVLGVVMLVTVLLYLQSRRVDWSVIGRAATLATATLPMIMYHRLILLWEPTLATRASQNITMTGHWSVVVIGYGALWIFAAVGVWLWCKHKTTISNKVVLCSWSATTLFFMIYPTQFQRRFFQGWIVILAVLAAPTCVWAWRRWVHTPSRRFIAIILFIILFCGSPLYLVAQDFRSYTQLSLSVKNPDYGYVTYTPHTDSLIWSYLNQLPPFSVVVLAYPYTALRVSAATRQHSYIAHGHETVGIKRKLQMANNHFFTDADIESLRTFLVNEKINYIYWGILEERHSQIRPDALPFLRPVVRTPHATLYLVEP